MDYPSFVIGEQDVLKIIKKYVESKPGYGYKDAVVRAKPYVDYGGRYEETVNKVSFEIVHKLDLGIGIGLSDITSNLPEDVAEAILKESLLEAGLQVNGIGFNVAYGGYGYSEGSYKVFNGIKVSLKSLSASKAPKQLVGPYN